MRAGAVPDRVLLGAGQHRDGLGQFGVGGQRAVRGQVGAQDVGQHQRVAGVGLLARRPRAGPGSGTPASGLIANTGRARWPAGRRPAGRGWSRSPPGSGRSALSPASASSSSSAANPAASSPIRRLADELAVVVDQGDVVVVFGPVDAAAHCRHSVPLRHLVVVCGGTGALMDSALGTTSHEPSGPAIGSAPARVRLAVSW